MAHEGNILSAVFSPDGKTIVTTCDDKDESSFSRGTSQTDGKRGFSMRVGKTARLWDATTGRPIGGPQGDCTLSHVPISTFSR